MKCEEIFARSLAKFLLTSDKHDRGQFLGYPVIHDAFQNFQSGLGLLIVDPGDQLRPVHVDPHENAVPFVPVETLADRQAGRLFTEHMNHFQLTLFHDHVKSVRIEALRTIFDAVINQQAVRELGAKLEGYLAA